MIAPRYNEKSGYSSNWWLELTSSHRWLNKYTAKNKERVARHSRGSGIITRWLREGSREREISKSEIGKVQHFSDLLGKEKMADLKLLEQTTA